MPNNNITVAVWMVTYNQQEYIEQAILSIINQKTNINFKLFIGDDHSSDNTAFICKKLAEKYPNKIDLTINVNNLGPQQNALNIYKKCIDSKAKYIAMCEGDDYWIDEYKLQKQIDFLEANPDFNICFTRAYLLKNNKLEPHKIPKINQNNIYFYDDLLKYHNFIATASVLIRTDDLPMLGSEFPNWFKQIPYGDMGLYLLACKTKKIKCLPDFTTVYRVHLAGLWSGMDKINQIKASLQFHQIIYPHLTIQQQNIVKQKQKELVNKLALIYTKNKLKKQFFKFKFQNKYKLK